MRIQSIALFRRSGRIGKALVIVFLVAVLGLAGAFLVARPHRYTVAARASEVASATPFLVVADSGRANWAAEPAWSIASAFWSA